MRQTCKIDVAEMDSALHEIGTAEHFHDEVKHHTEGGCLCAVAIRFAEMTEDSKELEAFLEGMVPTIFAGMIKGKEGLKSAIEAIFYVGCYIGQQSAMDKKSDEWAAPDELDLKGK